MTAQTETAAQVSDKTGDETTANAQTETAAQVSDKTGDETTANAQTQTRTQTTTDKVAEAEKADKAVAAKLHDAPMHITPEDAAHTMSAEHRVLGHRPPPGSVAAQAQSTADKVENFHKTADAVESKLQTDPGSVTVEDAKHVLSTEHKALGHFPPKDSISSDAQRVAAANERSAKDNENTGRGPGSDEKSPIALDDFESAAKEMETKLAEAPDNITKDDASKLRRLDTRAHGYTEKGSITAKVQSEADKHETAKRQDSVADVAAAAPEAAAGA